MKFNIQEAIDAGSKEMARHFDECVADGHMPTVKQSADVMIEASINNLSAQYFREVILPQIMQQITGAKS